MPREARATCESGLYHVSARGDSRQSIFEDEADYQRFLELLRNRLGATGVELGAWCLMDNHYHLLLRDISDELSAFMSGLNGAYATYFNNRHHRTGHLFRGRFDSRCIEDEGYALTVVRSILRNPERAKVAKTNSYRWSSYAAYREQGGMLSKSLVKELFPSIDELYRFVDAPGADGTAQVLEQRGRNRRADDELRAYMQTEFSLEARELGKEPRARRDSVLRHAKREGFPIRQIERVTGISHGVIQRA